MPTPEEAEILSRFVEAFADELGCRVVPVPRDEWATVSPTFRFGYRPPAVIDNKVVVPVSPELLAAVTAGWPSEERDLYLIGVVTYVTGFLTLPGLPLDRATAQVEGIFQEQAPELLPLMSEVEARALDDGTVLVS